MNTFEYVSKLSPLLFNGHFRIQNWRYLPYYIRIYKVYFSGLCNSFPSTVHLHSDHTGGITEESRSSTPFGFDHSSPLMMLLVNMHFSKKKHLLSWLILFGKPKHPKPTKLLWQSCLYSHLMPIWRLKPLCMKRKTHHTTNTYNCNCNYTITTRITLHYNYNLQGISPENMAKNVVLTYLHFRILFYSHLVGGIPTPLKNHGVKVSWDDDIPNWMEKKHVPNHQSLIPWLIPLSIPSLTIIKPW